MNKECTADKQLPSNTFTVTHVKENEDGSAIVEVEMGDEVRSKLFEEGLNFLMIKAAVGGTTDDIVRWVQLGKQEERTDELVKNFGEIYTDDTK